MSYSVREIFPFVWRWRSVHGPDQTVGYAFGKRAAKRAAAGRYLGVTAQLGVPDHLPPARPERSQSTPASP